MTLAWRLEVAYVREITVPAPNTLGPPNTYIWEEFDTKGVLKEPLTVNLLISVLERGAGVPVLKPVKSYSNLVYT
jgi:hypothetical protein